MSPWRPRARRPARDEPRARRWRHRHGLFLRVYLHALLLVGAFFAVGVVVLVLPGHRHPPRPAAMRLVARTAAALDLAQPRAALDAELAEIADQFDVRVAVVHRDGRWFAGDVHLAKYHGDEARRVHHPRGLGRHVLAAPVGGPHGEGVLLVSLRLGNRARRAMWTLAAGLAVLALLAYPLARGIAGPLERLARTARAFGEGDLDARAALGRRDELGEVGEAFDAMAARMQAARKAERQLLADVSHELKTPIARLRVALEMAEEVEDAAELKGLLAGLGGDLAELEDLVGDVLAVVRLDGAAETRRAEVHLADLLGAAEARFAQHHRGVTLHTAACPDLAVTVDAMLVRRALDNLLDNAAAYGGQGAVGLLPHVKQGAVCIDVVDHGPGIPAADRERVFEPFVRLDGSRARHSGGTGLGLALCRRVARAHGGDVEVLDTPGGGTTMRFTLPIAQA